MIGIKKYLYPVSAVLLAGIFLFMMVYSLWYGAKNTGDIITITDSYTQSEYRGTKVYHHTTLNDKKDAGQYHRLIDDSVPVRFAGFLSRFIDPLYVWSAINIFGTLIMVWMLWKLISECDRGILRFLLAVLAPFVPAFFRGATQLGAYVLSGVLLLSTIYVGYLKEASVIKWYFAMALCAIVVSFVPDLAVIVFIIPFVAYRDIKSNYNGGKAASHILLLLLAAIVIRFMFLKAFIDYKELYDALTNKSEPTILVGIKNFFVLDTKEKIGIYLPINVMAFVSVYGLFATEKYVKKYIYPGVFLYLWTVMFMGDNSYMLSVIYPALFFAFLKTIIHAYSLRKLRMAVTVALAVVLPFCLISCVNISLRNHIRGLNTAYYVEEYAALYNEYTEDKSTVLSVDDERNLPLQMYAAYPRKTLLSTADDSLCPRIIGTYYPDYIISRYELNYAEYRNVYSDENKYVYKLDK